jgi:hypothetical protein
VNRGVLLQGHVYPLRLGVALGYQRALRPVDPRLCPRTLISSGRTKNTQSDEAAAETADSRS